MKLHHIRHLLAIAEHGSLHRASARLGVAQSALSRSLVELEASLGTVLVERSRAGSLLTDAGQRFLVRARSIAEEMRRAQEEAAQHGGSGTGRVAFSMSPSAQMVLLPDILRPFHARWPDVTLTVQDGMAEDCEAGLVAGRLDFYVGACPNRPLDPCLRDHPLRQVDRVVLARPDSRWLGHRRLRDLVDAPWVSICASADTEADGDAIFRANGLQPPRPFGVATSMLAAWLMMRAVDALAIVPRAWLDGTPGGGIFTPLHLDDPLGAVELCSVRRAALPLTPAAQHLFDLIVAAGGRSDPA
jgi:DNA-binding transcriptional LysR family regulator